MVAAKRGRRALPEVRELTSEEARAIFEEDCRRILGIGADEFVRCWQAGEYGDPDETNPDIWRLVILLLFVGVDPLGEHAN